MGFVLGAWGLSSQVLAISISSQRYPGRQTSPSSLLPLACPNSISGTPNVFLLGNTCGKDSGPLHALKCSEARRRVTYWAPELPL